MPTSMGMSCGTRGLLLPALGVVVQRGWLVVACPELLVAPTVLGGGVASEVALVAGGGSATAGAVAGCADGWTVERAVQPVTATAAANRTVVMIRAGRMATSSLVK